MHGIKKIERYEKMKNIDGEKQKQKKMKKMTSRKPKKRNTHNGLKFQVVCRFDTEVELEYYKNGECYTI
uniref:Uncharacterized protein n=1 Tax=Romanomermis culicivorax TaxID=13658 RepID=A0A915J4M3_ROMCU